MKDYRTEIFIICDHTFSNWPNGKRPNGYIGT